MNPLIQIPAAILGTFGFCLVFHVGKNHIPLSALGGGFCWIVYLLLIKAGVPVFFSVFGASAFIGVYAVVFAHLKKLPTTILFIPALLPLIPGSNLYYMLIGILSQNWESFRENARLLALFALGIATGLAFVLELEHIRARLFHN